MGRQDRKAQRRKDRKAVKQGQRPPSMGLKQGQTALAKGLNEAFHRIKLLDETAEMAIDELEARIRRLESHAGLEPYVPEEGSSEDTASPSTIAAGTTDV